MPTSRHAPRAIHHTTSLASPRHTASQLLSGRSSRYPATRAVICRNLILHCAAEGSRSWRLAVRCETREDEDQKDLLRSRESDAEEGSLTWMMPHEIGRALDERIDGVDVIEVRADGAVSISARKATLAQVEVPSAQRQELNNKKLSICSHLSSRLFSSCSAYI
ncbi:hypothetical protein FA09DRAFT_137087 [Tilletiopsis washingtonensis]|uniref:Uncharacterized protein n=1 Tax=Tilletiopsis washingtonensis TaxID=58919 RepID=A0A316Z646_9BASI|nr:hypothetical protein FA09DRAFT_137087 [Tilletiopsis washingtonensis]PWN95685.1 hypothetical protein FA09DRAFT_137087 [Tilletiopsis washingtonensis]